MTKKGFMLCALAVFTAVGAFCQENDQAQYNLQIEQYKKGSLTQKEKITLSYRAHVFHQDSLSNAIANDVIANYDVDKTPLDRDMIIFLAGHTRKVSDKGFNLMVNRSSEINKIIDRPYFTENTLIEIILNSDIDLGFTSSKSSPSPRWNSLEKSLKKKYGKSLGDWAFLASKMRYYKLQEDWNEYSKTIVQYTNQYKLSITTIALNNYGWDIFVHSDNPEYLSIAESWLKPIVEGPEPFFGMIDTYANLLYKQNKAHDAISWETRALALAPADKGTKLNLEKMKKGEKTW